MDRGQQRSLRGIFNPRARCEKMHSEGRDLRDIFASCERDVAQHRIATGADFQKPVQVASVVEHAPAAYRDLLKGVPLENRESYQGRAYVREWTTENP